MSQHVCPFKATSKASKGHNPSGYALGMMVIMLHLFMVTPSRHVLSYSKNVHADLGFIVNITDDKAHRRRVLTSLYPGNEILSRQQ